MVFRFDGKMSRFIGAKAELTNQRLKGFFALLLNVLAPGPGSHTTQDFCP